MNDSPHTRPDTTPTETPTENNKGRRTIIGPHGQILTPWPKGVSGNPGGRPKSKPVTQAYNRLRRMPLEKLKTYKPKNLLEAQALKMLTASGSNLVPAVVEVTNRLEGPVPRAADDKGGVDINLYSINVRFGPRGAEAELVPKNGNGNGNGGSEE